MLSQDYDNYLVVVVDWASPDDLQEYLATIEDPKLAWISTKKPEHFSLSGARNLGGMYLITQNISVDMIAFIDADVLLPIDFLTKNLEGVEAATSFFFQRNKTVKGDLSIWGSCICPFRAWRDIRYNEAIDTYGEEDNEFYSVMVERGYRKRTLKTEGIEIIPHSDELRMQFYRENPEDIPRLKREHKQKFRAPPWQ